MEQRYRKLGQSHFGDVAIFHVSSGMSGQVQIAS
jgi:hypothetical protein